LLLAPAMWLHYLILLIVPLAIARPRVGAIWLVPVVTFGFTQPPGHPPLWEIAVVLAVMGVVVGAALRLRDPAEQRTSLRARRPTRRWKRPDAQPSFAASVHSSTLRAAGD
jgi:hypothetical protein